MSRKFTKMMDESKAEMMVFRRKNAAASYVFDLLTWHMGTDNSVIISVSAICEILDMNRRSVSRALKILKENKLVNIARTGASNIYYVNPDIVKVAKDGCVHYHFRTRVILSDSEGGSVVEKLKRMNNRAYFDAKDRETKLKTRN